MRWLPVILDTGKIVVGSVGQLGDEEGRPLVDLLTQWKLLFLDLNEEINSLPDLPDGLSSTSQQDVINKATREIEELQSLIQAWADQYPEPCLCGGTDKTVDDT